MSEASTPETPLPPTPCSLNRQSILDCPPIDPVSTTEVVARPLSARKKLKRRLWQLARFVAHVLLRLVCSSVTAAVIEEVVEEEFFGGYHVTYV